MKLLKTSGLLLGLAVLASSLVFAQDNAVPPLATETSDPTVPAVLPRRNTPASENAQTSTNNRTEAPEAQSARTHQQLPEALNERLGPLRDRIGIPKSTSIKEFNDRFEITASPWHSKVLLVDGDLASRVHEESSEHRAHDSRRSHNESVPGKHDHEHDADHSHKTSHSEYFADTGKLTVPKSSDAAITFELIGNASFESEKPSFSADRITYHLGGSNARVELVGHARLVNDQDGVQLTAERITNWGSETRAEAKVRLRRKGPSGDWETIIAERLEINHKSGTIRTNAEIGDSARSGPTVERESPGRVKDVTQVPGLLIQQSSRNTPASENAQTSTKNRTEAPESARFGGGGGGHSDGHRGFAERLQAEEDSLQRAVEDYLSALLDGRDEDARKLLDKSHRKHLANSDWMNGVRQHVQKKKVAIDRIVVRANTALATSESLSLSKPIPGIGDSGRLLLQLRPVEGDPREWRVVDVDISSDKTPFPSGGPRTPPSVQATDHENTPTTLAPPRDTLVGETTHINGTFLQAAKANRDAAAERLARQLADVKLALTLHGDTVRDGAMAKSALRQFFDRDMEYREAQLEQLGKRIERSAAQLNERQSARDELIDLQLSAFKMDAEGLGLTTKRIPARSTPTQSTPAERNSDGARRAGVGATAAPVTVSGAFKADPTALFPVGELDAQIRVRFQALAEAKGDEQKAKALNSLRTALRKYFDADMKARLASLESLKGELAELWVRHKTRAESKDEIIDLQLKLFINEANGLGFFSKIEPKETHPNLDGRWKLVSLIQDEQKTPVEKLKGAYVDIKDNLMVFHAPSKPDFPDLHIKYQFAAKGIDLQITDSREQDYAGPTFDGQWSLKDQQFKFACWQTSETQKVRPPLAPGKSVIYVELERIRPSR